MVSFEHKDGPGTPADLFVYEIASNRVFRVTNTPTFDESLNDISVLPNGDVRLVWAANDDLAGEHNIYARTLTLPALDTEPPAQPGDILVVDPDVPPVSTAVLFRVDPQSGARSVLSNFGTSNPNAVAVEANGNILVTDNAAGTDPSGGTNEWGALHRISRDPVTGDLVRTILTDFGVGPNTGRNPRRGRRRGGRTHPRAQRERRHDWHSVRQQGRARAHRPRHGCPNNPERLRKHQSGWARGRAARSGRRSERIDPRHRRPGRHRRRRFGAG